MWRWQRKPSGPWGDRQLKEETVREVYLRRLSRRGAALTTHPFGRELFIEPKVEASLFFLMEKEGEMLSGSQAWANCGESWWQILKDGLKNEQWGMSAGTGSWDKIEIAMYVSVCAENSRVFFLIPMGNGLGNKHSAEKKCMVTEIMVIRQILIWCKPRLCLHAEIDINPLWPAHSVSTTHKNTSLKISDYLNNLDLIYQPCKVSSCHIFIRAMSVSA